MSFLASRCGLTPFGKLRLNPIHDLDFLARDPRDEDDLAEKVPVGFQRRSLGVGEDRDKREDEQPKYYFLVHFALHDPATFATISEIAWTSLTSTTSDGVPENFTGIASITASVVSLEKAVSIGSAAT